jgi:hypothetical protein
MKIRLIRKLADYLDGIDLSHRDSGDVVDLPSRQADLLIAEGWAQAIERRTMPRRFSLPALRAEAADRPRRTTDQLRKHRMERRHLALREQRRAEDRIREELHDSRARIVAAHTGETS